MKPPSNGHFGTNIICKFKLFVPCVEFLLKRFLLNSDKNWEDLVLSIVERCLINESKRFHSFHDLIFVNNLYLSF